MQNGKKKPLVVLPTGCHALGEKVLMSDGTVRAVENVNVGDYLMGDDGEPRTVLHKSSGTAELYQIIPIKGDPFIVTGDHKLTLVQIGDINRQQKAEANGKFIKDVRVSDWLTWKKSTKHVHKLMRSDAIESFGNNKPLPLSPYVLGVLLGDGGLKNNIKVTNSDFEIINKIDEELSRLGSWLERDTSDASATYNIKSGVLGCKGSELHKILLGLGVRYCGAGDKEIPFDYKTADKKNRLQILAGILDTDGHMSHSGYDFISKSEQLSNDVVFIARSLGLAAYAKKCRKGINGKFEGEYYRVYISGDCSIIPCCVSRKKAPKRQQIKNVLHTGFSVKPVGVGEYCGFTVDKNNRYLLDDFTITHNSGKTVCFAWLAKATQDNNKIVWFLVHRRELLDQTLETFKKFKIKTESIYIGMVGQVANNADKFPAPDLIIFDECFPAGTLIDGKPIESFKVGDIVSSFNHKTKQVESKKVLRVFARQPSDTLIRINKSLVCTPEHPIFIKESEDYVEAKNIEPGTSMLLYLRTETGMVGFGKVEKRPIQEKRKNILFHRVRERVFKNGFKPNDGEDKQEIRIGENESKQPNAQSRFAREDEANASRNGAQASCSRRERKRFHQASADSTRRVKRSRFGRRIYSANKITEAEQTQNSNTLQNRHSNTGSENRNRNRWTQSFRSRKASSRSKEESLPREFRVESVEILQRGSYDGFESLCPDGYVYNLEVEGNNNYFANDILVHNCHHAAAGTWRKITDRFPKSWVIGLTATPCRLDGKPLKDVFDDLVVGVSTYDLIEQGFLSNYKFYSVKTVDLSGIRTKGSDYDMTYASAELMQRAVYGDVINTYKKHANGLQAICFCTTVIHSKATADAFNDAGIKAVHFDGNTSDKKRKEIIAKFRAGEIDILCNVELVGEGFDMPACDCVIQLRPTQSLTIYLQQVGRALRPREGKTAIILDHVGNVNRHGLPDDDRTWSLSEKIAERRQFNKDGTLAVRTCTECFACYPSAFDFCTVCGAQYQTTREEIKNIEFIELMEIERKKQEAKEERIKNLFTEKDCKNYSDFYQLAKKTNIYNPRQYAIGKCQQRGYWYPGRR